MTAHAAAGPAGVAARHPAAALGEPTLQKRGQDLVQGPADKPVHPHADAAKGHLLDARYRAAEQHLGAEARDLGRPGKGISRAQAHRDASCLLRLFGIDQKQFVRDIEDRRYPALPMC